MSLNQQKRIIVLTLFDNLELCLLYTIIFILFALFKDILINMTRLENKTYKHVASVKGKGEHFLAFLTDFC